MAELLDDVSYLSREIGPRPAGTEEEQQAALYIADQVHQRTGFHAEIEDTKCMASADLVGLIYLAVAFVCLLLAFLLPTTSIVTMLLSLVGAVMFVMEEGLKRPLLSRLLTRDISQNVVVKYKPAAEMQRAGKPRKIVVVANYDTGRVRHETKPRFVGIYAFFARAGAVSVIATPILILLRNIVLAGSLGVVSALLSLLCVVALALLAVEMIFLALRRISAYNEGANNNASSIAAMLEVLRRIDGTAAPENAPHPRATREEDAAPAKAAAAKAAAGASGAVAESDQAAPVVHGPEAARAAGVVPAGADLTYDDDVVAPAAAPAGEAGPAPAAAPEAARRVPAADAGDAESAASRLRSAKAAIAALTGEAVNDEIFLDLNEEPVASAAPAAPMAAAATAEAPSSAPVGQPVVEHIGSAHSGDELQPASPATAPAAAAAVAAGVAAAAVTAAPAAAVPAPAPAPDIQPVVKPPAKPSEPAWYTAARAKAHRQAEVPAKRSRFADALDTAAAEGAAHFRAESPLVDEGTEERLRQMRESFAAPEPAPVVEASAQPSAPAAAEPAPAPVQPVAAAPAVPTEESVPAPAAAGHPAPAPGPEVEPAPASPASTAAFTPIGTQGEVAAFEADFEMGDEEPFVPYAPVEEPEEAPIDIAPVEAEAYPLPVDAAAEAVPVGDAGETIEAEAGAADGEEADDGALEVLDAELVEIIDDGEYADSEYDDYADADEPAGAAGGYAPEDENDGEGDRAESDRPAFNLHDLRREGAAAGARIGGFFSGLRDAIAPADRDDGEDRDDREGGDVRRADEAIPAGASAVSESDAEAAPAGDDAAEPAEDYGDVPEDGYDDEYDEEYDDYEEPSRFSDLRERVSGAFSRLTEKLSPAPDYEEQDYSYDEEYDSGDGYGPEDEYSPEDMLGDVSDERADATAHADGATAEMPPVIPDEERGAAPVDEYRAPEEPAAGPDEDYGQPEQTMFIDEPMEVEEPAGFDVDEPVIPYDEAEDGPVEPAYGTGDPASDVLEEPAAAAPEDEYGFEPEEPAAAPEGGYADEYDEGYGDEYEEWEEEPERGGIKERLSGFWHRLTGRDARDEGYYDDYGDGYGDASTTDEGSDEPSGEEGPASAASQPEAAGAEPGGDFAYQTAYAPARAHVTSLNEDYEAAAERYRKPVAASAEAVAAQAPAAVAAAGAVASAAATVAATAPKTAAPASVVAAVSPAPAAVPEPETTSEPAPASAAPAAPEPVVEDPTNQQVVVQPDESGEYEAPIAVSVPDVNPSASRPANPRFSRSGRFDSTVAGWGETQPEFAAEFAAEEIEPIVSLDDEGEDAVETVVPYAGLDGADDPSGTVAMPRIDVSEFMDAGAPAGKPADEDAAAVEPEPASAPGTSDAPAPQARLNVPEIGPDIAPSAAPAPSVKPDGSAKPHLSALIPRIDLAETEAVPAVAPAGQPVVEEEEELSRTARLRRLRTSLPSMSGTISDEPIAPADGSADGTGASPSKTGPFPAPHTTASFEPTGGATGPVEPVAASAPAAQTQAVAPAVPVQDEEDVWDGQSDAIDEAPAVEDVRAAAAAAGEPAAYAPTRAHASGHRHHGLFGHRRHRDAEDEISPQEWLGVSDDFDAREVGKARGDWSSFRANDARASVGDRDADRTMGWRADRLNPDPKSDYDTGLDSAFADDEEEFLDEDTGQNNGRWMGGAFSTGRSASRDRYHIDDEWAEFAEYSDENYDENDFPMDADADGYADYAEPEPVENARLSRGKGLVARFTRKGRADDSASRERSRGARTERAERRYPRPAEDDAWNVAAARAAERSVVNSALEDPLVQVELGETYGFVDDPIGNEVWFVAEGAGLSGNAGMEAFLAAHADELRGAVVINLEGIGDGELVGASSEGLLRTYKSTTRMKRFLRNAAQATGQRIDQAKMNWRDSPATVAMRRGMPAITIAGVDGVVPVNYGSGNDVVENLDEDLLKQRVNFILELLRAI